MKWQMTVGAGLCVVLLAACTSSTGSTNSNQPPTDTSAHRGGTLHLVANAAGGTIDPQINYTQQYWQLFQDVYDGLLAFKKVDGADSTTIVPDLAESVPSPTNDGKTYVFKLRKGITFSDGSPVTVPDVVASFQRIFKVLSPTSGTFFQVIKGADICIKTPASCTLAGGLVGDAAAGTITFNLTTPDSEFLDKLAIPHASILPAAAPSHDAGTTPILGTGPYVISAYNPNAALTLTRNPHFKVWSQDAQPDGYPDVIEQTYGLTSEAEVTAVENGQADWMFDPVPADRLVEVGTKYASQAHINTLSAFWYAPLNVNLPPFNNLQARQAVNWAVDRNALVKVYGGSNLATPTCQILPPSFPGHQDYCPYTNPSGTTWSGPDLNKAKQLVQQSGTAGQSVGIVVANDATSKAMGEYLQSVLNEIGYKATVKALSGSLQFTYIQNTNNKVQISVSQWFQDYPAASDFLYVLFGCASFHPGSDSSINISGYCDPTVDAAMKHALITGVTDKTAANTEWAAIDKQVTDAAASVPLFTPKQVDFLSSRVGNYKFAKVFFFNVDQAWVQ